tara:strand:+ start:88 stop:453 length:366 start_codon:yes stop_codon:yes gene_type:complete
VAIGAIVIQVVVKNVLTMCVKLVSVVIKKMIFKHEKFVLDLNAATKAKLYSENKLVFMGDGYKAILILINSSSNPEPVKKKFEAQLKLREKPKFSQPDDMEQLRQKALNSIVKTPLKKKKR